MLFVCLFKRIGFPDKDWFSRLGLVFSLTEKKFASRPWRTTSASPRRPARTSRGGWISSPAGTGGLSSRRRGGTRVCYRRGRSGARRGVRSEMALRGVAPALRAYHINVLELFAVAVAVHCWGEESHDQPILLHTDNMPVVHVWTMGTCKCPHLMSLVRRLFFFLAQRSVNLLLGHVPGCQNINADMLSRLQVAEFRSGACGTLPIPTMVPSHVWEWLPLRPRLLAN